MNILNINEQYIINLGNVTVLKGNSNIWYNVISTIKEFFTVRTTKLNISINSVAITKKDWEFMDLSLGDTISFNDRITTKSPIYLKLSDLLKEHIETPEYKLLQESWEELIQLMSYNFNNQMNSLNLPLTLKAEPLDVSNIVSSLAIDCNICLDIFEQKLILAKWFLSSPQVKNRLLIFEYPELYTNTQSLLKFIKYINEVSNPSTYIIFVSNYDFPDEYQYNLIINDQILNEYYLQMLYSSAEEFLPFQLNYNLYINRIKIFLNIWHRDFYNLLNNQTLKVQYIIVFICKKLNIQIDISMILDNNIIKFYNYI